MAAAQFITGTDCTVRLARGSRHYQEAVLPTGMGSDVRDLPADMGGSRQGMAGPFGHVR